VENVAPVIAAIPSQTVTKGVLLTFTASATDADLPANTLTYSLIGAPTGASINSSTGVFTWTPTETQGPGTFNFTVSVSDGNLTHDQPVAVTVTDDSGADVLGTWIVAGQSNAEGYGITESPISGLAPASTLATIGRGDLNVTHNNIQMFQGANENNGITASAGLSLPPKNAWHAMTASEGLAFDWGSGRGNESKLRFGPELAFGYDVQGLLGTPTALSFELNPTDTTVGSNINDLVSVAGNLNLDGLLSVVATSGDFLSVAINTSWRLFNYSGSLSDDTLSLGAMPSLGSGLSWGIDTATSGQVNLMVIPEPGAALLGSLGLLALLRRRR